MSREKIKTAALELFQRYSYVKTSVSDIANAAGIGKGTIYLSFKTKEEILFALLDDEILVRRNDVAPQMFDPGRPLDEKLEVFTKYILDLHFKIRDLMFGSFENVQGRELQDVYLKLSAYIDQSTEFLGQVITLHGFQAGPRRQNQLREYFLFLSGRTIAYILSHDWNARDGLYLVLPSSARRIFYALVPLGEP